MKKIEAVIKPFKLEQVRDALGALGLEGMTITEVRGFGHQTDHGIAHGALYNVEFLPRIKIEMVVADDQALQALRAIVKAARTGKIGDGKVFVSTIDQAVRIRTNERGDRGI